ncbi:MAG: hypothetical protein OXC68_05780 [Aestuariivita sp.]|nr:hypothetical protein [Aestuariivita sp.]
MDVLPNYYTECLFYSTMALRTWRVDVSALSMLGSIGLSVVDAFFLNLDFYTVEDVLFDRQSRIGKIVNEQTVRLLCFG